MHFQCLQFFRASNYPGNSPCLEPVHEKYVAVSGRTNITLRNQQAANKPVNKLEQNQTQKKRNLRLV